MAEFVDQDRDGVDLMPLPGRCRLWLADRHGGDPARYYLMRPWSPTSPEIGMSPQGSIMYAVAQASWAKRPPAISVYRALRHFADVDELRQWAVIRGVADEDLAWFRERRAPLGSVAKMTDEQARRAIGALARELAEREQGKKPRPYDVWVNGVSAYDLTPDQLADLSIAVDWHLGAPGRREALAEVIGPAVDSLAQLPLPLGKRSR